SRQEALQRAHAAVTRIGRDVQSAVREGDLFYARVFIVDEDDRGAARDEMLIFGNSMQLVRPTSDVPEGGAYEIQYRVAPDGGGARARAARRDGQVLGLRLWRRVDPIPDETPDGGGVVFPVVTGLTALSFEAFDGESWKPEWDSDRDGYPHAVRIAATAISTDGRFRETARRVVALDRVPLPYVKVRAADEDENGGGR
ncbi:MAG: type II secretion system protein GspJ, partial [Planctomycetota bacterium]